MNPTTLPTDNNALTLTENGDKAFLTSGDKNLDFFTRITRNAPIKDIVDTFVAAWNEDPSTAAEVLMNLRDPRKGKQEKLIPIVVLVYLKFTIPPNVYEAMLRAMVPYGYWKDLLKIHEIATRVEVLAKKNAATKKSRKTKTPSTTSTQTASTQTAPIELTIFAQQLQTDYNAWTQAEDLGKKASISLAAKWAPSEKSHFDNHPMFAARTMKAIMGLSAKEYRQMLTKLRNHLNILEMLMASQQYDKIDFSKLPATAMKKMSKAFKRDVNSNGVESEARKKLHLSYTEFMIKLCKGETKINVTGIQPHELVSCYFTDRNENKEVDQLVEEQWNTLMKRVLEKGAFNKVTAVVDVSGSMEGTPMQVAIALGIMVADCTCGPFAKQVITFHESPTWHKLVGNTLQDKVTCMKAAPWGSNTNLRKVFDLILNEALRYQLTPEQMVETLFVFTDMQFDCAFRDGGLSSTFEDIKTNFETNGYKLPKIVFWNLRTSDAKSLPVMQNEENVAMLSGFSSELLNCIIDAQEFTPITMMRHVLKPYMAPKEVRNCAIGLFPHDLSVLELAVKASEIKKSFKEVTPTVKTEPSSNLDLDSDLDSDSDSSSSLGLKNEVESIDDYDSNSML
jgi:hypothetical protein